MNKIFNEDGNFIYKSYDPYRVDSDLKEYHCNIFDKEYGDLTDKAGSEAANLMHSGKCRWDCDAAKCLHADIFSGSTKGNYSAIFYWR